MVETDREILRDIQRQNRMIMRLVLLSLRGERQIIMGQQDIDDAVAAVQQTANDLMGYASTTQARVSDVDAEVKALQAQIAAGGPVDTTNLVSAVAALKDAHDAMQTAVQTLADDTNVPSSGSGQVGDTGTGGPGGSSAGTPEGSGDTNAA